MILLEEKATELEAELDDGPRSGPWPYPGQCEASLHPPGLSHGYSCTRPDTHGGDHIDGPSKSAHRWTDKTPHSRPHSPRVHG